MWRHLPLLTLLLVASTPLVCLENVQAQSATGSDAPQAGVVLSELSDPAYPSLAPLGRQVRVVGDVP